MKPVLVDTSVWRRYFSGDIAVRTLGDLLDDPSTVLVHPWVLGELLLGGLSKREQELFERLPSAEVLKHEEVLELIRRRKLARRGIGWVDVNLLGSALAGSSKLWTLDASLHSAAEELRIHFNPRSGH